MEQFTNDMIKSQIADNISTITYLTSIALIQNDKDYLLYFNDLLTSVITNLVDETIYEEEE